MTHPLVDQLRFTRREFQRNLKSLSAEDAVIRFEPLNCISWTVGHVAWQEQTRLLCYGQGRKKLFPELDELCGRGQPASTPPLKDMLRIWKAVTQANDAWLDGLTQQQLLAPYVVDGVATNQIWGSVLLRVTYHYWYHLGEVAGIRQRLGHSNLPQFVGNIDRQAPYQPEH